jgi:flagellar biosynthesis protein FlhF
MQIKTFRAPTASEAVQLVKKDLGPDAVILKNKKVTLSPAESYVEIIAAVEPDQTGRTELAQNSLMRNQHDDIREIKSLLSMLISSRDYFTQLQLQEPISEIYHSLLARGLDEKQTFILLKKALSGLANEHIKKDEITASFCEQLLSRINVAAPLRSLPAGKFTTYTFVGPTGVGKTTTLAKLAAYLKVKRQMDIGVISIDTYRIGAVRQLKTYTEILDVPLLVAQNGYELRRARDELKHRDAILVDTTGKNFLNNQHTQDLQEVFGADDDLYHFLVLSATAKDEDLKQTVKHFKVLGIQSLIFTKVDETLNHGSMINQLLRFSYPASYLGTGQRVPEDIQPASRKLLSSLLFPSEKAPLEKE